MSGLCVSSKDVASWCETKPLQEVMSIMEDAHIQGVQVTHAIIYNLIQNCIKKKDVAAAKRVYTLMVKSDHVTAALGDQLIRFFTSSRCLLEANRVFNSILFPSVHTWHAIISAHSVCGEKMAALSLYHRMQQHAVQKPNAYIFSCVLKTCSGLGDLRHGALTHSDVVRMSLESDSVVGTALVDLYSKCNKLKEARKVFDNIKGRNVISWNAMLTGYVQHGQCLPALDHFERMQKDGVKPDRVTFLCIVKACSSLGSIERCKLLHEQLIQSGLVSDLAVGNALIDMYAKCGELQRANDVFESLPVRDVVSWSAIIAGYVHHGHGFAALDIFKEMQEEGIRPEKVTFLCVLKACGILGAYVQGRVVHDQLIRNGLVLDVMIGNTLIDMYAKCGSLEEAGKVFEGLLDRTIVSWNAILLGYSQQGLDRLALEHFEKMQEESIRATTVTFSTVLKVCGSMGALKMGERLHDRIIKEHLERDLVVGNSLIDMYGKCGRLDSAYKAFCCLLSANVVSWGALIAGYTQHENFLSALVSFQKMLEEEVEPDLVIVLSTLKACGGMGVLKWGKLIYDYALRKGLESDLGVGNTLVDMYARCGSLLEAEVIFNRLLNQNIVSWNAMIAGYAQHGYCKQAIRWFENMQLLHMKPTSQTFISILAACTHGGQVEDGYKYLKCMLNDYEISPGIEHFNCIIDLLGRAGHLIDAERLLNTMPELPNINGWMSLLTSSLLFGNVDVARRSFEQVVKLNPDTSAGHVLMLNIYADAQMWEDVLKLHESRRSLDVWKKPGQAFLEVNGKLHEFIVGDITHLQSKDMHSKVRNLHTSLKGGGYVPNSEILFESTFGKEYMDDELRESAVQEV